MAVEAAFGWNVDYAMLTKQYVGDSNLPDAAHRYSPEAAWEWINREAPLPFALFTKPTEKRLAGEVS